MVGIESLYGSPNSLSMSILAVLPITLFLRKIKNRITETWPPFYRRSFVIILYVNLVLSVLGIALTNSRGGMVAFICYILILVFLNQKKFTTKVRYGVAGALFLCILWSVLPVDKQARLETVWNPEAGPKNATTSAMGRIEGLKAGVEMFEDYPFSGVGLGNFIPYRVAYIDEVPLNSHNLVGQLLGETGLLGLLTFSLLIATLLRNIKKIQALSSKVRLPTDNIMYAFSRACRDSLYMLLFLGMFNHNLKRYNWFWLAAFILLALKFVRDKCDESKLKSN